MRITRILLIVAGFVFCAVSSAQGNSIIDNCCFVNWQCPTNQAWIDGWHAFQRNECPASQPVAQASAPVSAPAGQPIDNCCNVNRQCQSDQEWIDGWHAYQNGQCAAPSQPQPVSSGPANVDNCCYVDRQCLSDQDWIDGWHAYQHGLCAAPRQPQRATPSGSMPRIEGSDIFVNHIITSLNWLKRLSPRVVRLRGKRDGLNR